MLNTFFCLAIFLELCENSKNLVVFLFVIKLVNFISFGLLFVEIEGFAHGNHGFVHFIWGLLLYFLQCLKLLFPHIYQYFLLLSLLFLNQFRQQHLLLWDLQTRILSCARPLYLVKLVKSRLQLPFRVRHFSVLNYLN